MHKIEVHKWATPSEIPHNFSCAYLGAISSVNRRAQCSRSLIKKHVEFPEIEHTLLTEAILCIKSLLSHSRAMSSNKSFVHFETDDWDA